MTVWRYKWRTRQNINYKKYKFWNLTNFTLCCTKYRLNCIPHIAYLRCIILLKGLLFLSLFDTSTIDQWCNRLHTTVKLVQYFTYFIPFTFTFLSTYQFYLLEVFTSAISTRYKHTLSRPKYCRHFKFQSSKISMSHRVHGKFN